LAKLSDLLEHTKTVTVDGVQLELRKYPLGFVDWRRMKDLEGKAIQTTAKGKITAVASWGDYSPAATAQTIAAGLRSWDITAEDMTILPVTQETAARLGVDSPALAGNLLDEVEQFNSVLDVEPQGN